MWTFQKWLSGGVCRCTNRLDGKTVVITGGNTGIGFETAKELAKRGAFVVIACRDLVKGDAAKTLIESSVEGAQIEVMKLDLASLTSVRCFAKDLLGKVKDIHVLINNAGAASTPKWKTEDGFDYQLGVNHLGHFLLTLLLIEKLRNSTPSRIINVSSIAHTRGKINFEDINFEKSYHSFTAYFQSKLANILFTKQLAKREKGNGISVYCLHPGAVNTELGRYLEESTGSFISNIFSIFSRFFFKTAWQGAQTSLHLALANDLENQSGEYFADCKIKNPAVQALDEHTAEKLWDVSEELVGLTQNK